MFRSVLIHRLAVAASLAAVAVPAPAQVNGPGRVYATSPRPAEPVTGGYPAAPPAVVVVPVHGQGPGRMQRPPAIQTAPNVVLGWGGLPPASGQPPPGHAWPGYAAPGYAAPGYAAPGYAAPGYVAPGYGHPPPVYDPAPHR